MPWTSSTGLYRFVLTGYLLDCLPGMLRIMPKICGQLPQSSTSDLADVTALDAC